MTLFKYYIKYSAVSLIALSYYDNIIKIMINVG